MVRIGTYWIFFSEIAEIGKLLVLVKNIANNSLTKFIFLNISAQFELSENESDQSFS